MSLDENKHGNQRLGVQKQSMVWNSSPTRNILSSVLSPGFILPKQIYPILQ